MIDFDDADPEDAICAGDVPWDEIDWTKVVTLQALFDDVHAIQDADERLTAAKQLVRVLHGR